MNYIRKTITLSPDLSDWIKAQIDAGGFVNESEVIRDAIRAKRAGQEHEQAMTALRAELQKGLDSGVSSMTIDEIWEQGIQEYKDGRRPKKGL